MKVSSTFLELIATMGKVRDDDPTTFTDIKLLSFDVYSTLVDEKGTLHNQNDMLCAS